MEELNIAFNDYIEEVKKLDTLGKRDELINILEELVKLNENKEFKKVCPDITAQEYLCAKVQPYIKPQRLVNILNLNVKRIRIDEVEIIAKALGVDISILFKGL